MVYFVGGATDSCKSLLALHMLARAGAPWLLLDVLLMGMTRGAPAFGLDPEADNLEEAAPLRPLVREMAENLVHDGRDHMIEGVRLDSRDVVAMVCRQRRAYFLGYPHIALSREVDFVLKHRDGPNDWLADEPPAAVRSRRLCYMLTVWGAHMRLSDVRSRYCAAAALDTIACAMRGCGVRTS